jgi:HEAT repeat protein
MASFERLFRLQLIVMLSLAFPVCAEISDSPKNQVLGPSDRYQKAKVGSRVEEWARHVDDEDPEVRLDAVKLLGQSGDPQANQYLITAVESADPRVASAAVDYLGKIKAKEAVPFLSDRLLLVGTSPSLRERILVALGRIGDADAGRRILEFIEGETDSERRATAIRVLGEIGNETVASDLQTLRERETDASQKALFDDAVARIRARAKDSSGQR